MYLLYTSLWVSKDVINFKFPILFIVLNINVKNLVHNYLEPPCKSDKYF